jgi:hypothetical protein
MIQFMSGRPRNWDHLREEHRQEADERALPALPEGDVLAWLETRTQLPLTEDSLPEEVAAAVLAYTGSDKAVLNLQAELRGCRVKELTPGQVKDMRQRLRPR